MSGDVVTAKVTGLAELGRAFLALSAELQNGRTSALRAGVSDGAKVLRDAARALVPYRSEDGDPHVRDRIIMARDREAPSDTERFVVMVAYKSRKYRNNRVNRRLGRAGKKYADYGNLFYWRYLEFGNSRQAASPFMRPAFDRSAGAALSAFRSGFSARLPAAVSAVKT
jgi:HK97 gp10 family phage protein